MGERRTRCHLVPPGVGERRTRCHLVLPGAGERRTRCHLVLPGAGERRTRCHLVPPGVGERRTRCHLVPLGYKMQDARGGPLVSGAGGFCVRASGLVSRRYSRNPPTWPGDYPGRPPYSDFSVGGRNRIFGFSDVIIPTLSTDVKSLIRLNPANPCSEMENRDQQDWRIRSDNPAHPCSSGEQTWNWTTF